MMRTLNCLTMSLTKPKMKNLLIKADNLEGLRYLLEERGLRGKIDLAYIDPPFATNVNFTVTDGIAATASSSKSGDTAYTDKVLGGDFVEFLRQRLLLIKELLSDRGSIYLHTDCRTGHYVRVMMDDVFGIENFRNDITRVKCNPNNTKRLGYGNIKDTILFYTKSGKAIWNEPKTPYSQDEIKHLFPKTDKKGRRYTTVPLHAPGKALCLKRFHGILPPAGRHWLADADTMEQWNKEGLIEWSSSGNPRKIVYADGRDGKRVQDIWTDFKDPQRPTYPTEKNMEMLDLIVRASSDEGSIVLDCFCGSGTTLQAAERNGRRWIGIDSSDLAIETSKKRMNAGGASLFGCETEIVRDISHVSGIIAENLDGIGKEIVSTPNQAACAHQNT